MVVGLNERFPLAKFVSSGTLTAIKSADQEGVRLGGERRLVTMMFCDIRGYTGFAERHDPEVVVEVLNLYFQNLSELVVSHGGDIDKYVGDQIVAVFQGEEMAANAVRCALAMQHKMAALAGENPDWHLAIGIGINTGDVILGAMGSRERMDYTVLGDHVNLAARLCAQAGPGQILITASSQRAIADASEFAITALAPIRLRGKSEPVPVYEVGALASDRAPAAHVAATASAALGSTAQALSEGAGPRAARRRLPALLDPPGISTCKGLPQRGGMRYGLARRGERTPRFRFRNPVKVRAPPPTQTISRLQPAAWTPCRCGMSGS